MSFFDKIKDVTYVNGLKNSSTEEATKYLLRVSLKSVNTEMSDRRYSFRPDVPCSDRRRTTAPAAIRPRVADSGPLLPTT